MIRRVFYSFHYMRDYFRVSQIRNFGVIEENQAASDNDWETVKRGGNTAIKSWIDTQMNGRSCTVVLIGNETAGRTWINYEIEKSWNDGKGLLGIHIHNLKDSSGKQSHKGANPFENFTLQSGDKLSAIIKVYDPPYYDSKHVYNYIGSNLPSWIEEAIRIRSSN